jgi:hypothetical protein
MRQISDTVWGILRRVDAKFPNVDREEVGSRHSRLITHLHSLLVSHREHRARMVCDYTGMNMSWAPGSRSPSIEAFYPFVVPNDQVQYHVPENVGRIFHVLNLVKNGSPIIHLPLIAHMLRTRQEPDFGRRKEAMSWAYIAMQNVNILGRITIVARATTIRSASGRHAAPPLVQKSPYTQGIITTLMYHNSAKRHPI